jgi:hypothetical protein
MTILLFAAGSRRTTRIRRSNSAQAQAMLSIMRLSWPEPREPVAESPSPDKADKAPR